MKFDTKYNSIKNHNIYRPGVSNGTICNLKLEQCERKQNIKGMYILIY